MFERYAIFYTPTGELADFGAAWLGWDGALGCVMPHLDIKDIDVATLTRTPRKYGLHGTLKAPFRLDQDIDQSQLESAAAAFAMCHKAFVIGELELRHENGFVALRPVGQTSKLQDLAAEAVKEFDLYRAPLSDADIARRRKSRLSARQDQQLLDWGYPFVFDDFHFHLTLTGRVSADQANKVISALKPRLDPVVPVPFDIDAITLMGQDESGMFHQIHRYTLTG
ncbi:DUF1045 domain-containing protein [Sulfitobacter sp. S223]|uniref:DUF1045 domain-containing protein n=1 Tax=Sulfitobacter sp. S223 TaxID=2867023 RepID=UPI0021A5297E|nr:DUF1045 domain-containing protein [Sulfitobacter sp. S223]UWR26595.1 DUF1045 domain-containing protein [Sulfitobacter sp. S223]